MKKSLQSLGFALNGLKTTWQEELNFRLEIVVALLVLLIIFIFHFTFIEAVLCILAVVMVLSAEIVNTAIEDLSDMVEPNQNPQIGKIKDTMAGFVLVVSVGAAIIGIMVNVHHFLFL